MSDYSATILMPEVGAVSDEEYARYYVAHLRSLYHALAAEAAELVTK